MSENIAVQKTEDEIWWENHFTEDKDKSVGLYGCLGCPAGEDCVDGECPLYDLSKSTIKPLMTREEFMQRHPNWPFEEPVP